MMKKNLSTKFSANVQNLIFKACFYPVMLPWQWHMRHLNYQNMIANPFNWCLAKFGDAGISGFWKMANVVEVSQLCSATLKAS